MSTPTLTTSSAAGSKVPKMKPRRDMGAPFGLVSKMSLFEKSDAKTFMTLGLGLGAGKAPGPE
jgi:hypothetical protein